MFPLTGWIVMSPLVILVGSVAPLYDMTPGSSGLVNFHDRIQFKVEAVVPLLATSEVVEFLYRLRKVMFDVAASETARPAVDAPDHCILHT